MSRLVVADAGPLIHLAQADALSLLELTGEVVVPKIVLDELERGFEDLWETQRGSVPVFLRSNFSLAVPKRLPRDIARVSTTTTLKT